MKTKIIIESWTYWQTRVVKIVGRRGINGSRWQRYLDYTCTLSLCTWWGIVVKKLCKNIKYFDNPAYIDNNNINTITEVEVFLETYI